MYATLLNPNIATGLNWDEIDLGLTGKKGPLPFLTEALKIPFTLEQIENYYGNRTWNRRRTDHAGSMD